MSRRANRQYRDDLRSLARLAENVERLSAEERRAEQRPEGYGDDTEAARLNAEPFHWNGGRF